MLKQVQHDNKSYNRFIGMNKFISILLFIFTYIFVLNYPAFSAEKGTTTAEHLKVEIVSPKEGEKVHGNITIEARVNHPEAVEYCEFYIQEPGAKDRYGWKDYVSPYYWGGDGQILDTTLLDDGSASAVVFCLPKDNKSVKFEKRVHFIIDNGKPQIRILSPKDYDVVNGNAKIKIYAENLEGINKQSGITAIYVYIDGGIFGKLFKPQFETFIETCLLSSGLHSIKVVAEDAEGLTATDKITIYVP